MLEVIPGEVEMPKLHHYLLGAVGPRPICFASTMNADGVPNLAPFSLFNVFSANPPIAVFSPAKSGRTGASKDTFNNAKATCEVVINIVNHDMVHQMSLTSSPYAPDVDEFVKSGFTKVKSDLIKPFRVKESPVQMECKVIEIKELGENGGAGNLIICEILKIHISEEVLDENQMIDQLKIDQVARMGGNWYCRANKDSMFEIVKPITICGIGLDQLPSEVVNSEILTGNDLGKLGNVENLPDETEVNEYKLMELSELFQKFEDDKNQLEIELHQLAKDQLANNQVIDALKTLLAFNN